MHAACATNDFRYLIKSSFLNKTRPEILLRLNSFGNARAGKAKTFPQQLSTTSESTFHSLNFCFRGEVYAQNHHKNSARRVTTPQHHNRKSAGVAMSMRFVNLALVLFIPTFCSPHTLCCKCAASGQVMNNFYSSFTNTSRSFNSMNDETASRNNFYNFTARSALMEAFVAPRCMDVIVCGEFCCEFPMKRHKREMTSNNRHSHN